MYRSQWENEATQEENESLQAWQQQMAYQQQVQAQQHQAMQYWYAQRLAAQQQAAILQQQRQQTPGMLPLEQSFIENILRLNRGKMATVYMTFENNSEWNAKIFKGRIEAAGRDHIVLSDPETGVRYLLLMVNLDYITFNEPLNYEYPFGGQQLTTMSPR